MGKKQKTVRHIFIVASVICVIIVSQVFLSDSRVVATAEGNKIIYNSATYVENFEVFDFTKGKCIGRVDFPQYGFKCKMYSILEMPDNFFVDMGRDYRIYKKIPKLSENELIGKTSAEIEKIYGAFDCVGISADDDGIYRNCRCGYTVTQSQKGFLQASPEVLLFVIFDENGIAISCEEGYRPGG